MQIDPSKRRDLSSPEQKKEKMVPTDDFRPLRWG
jgi:hypothetical protein